MVWSNWHLGWPWLCLGGGLMLFAVLLGTDALPGHAAGSRWWEPVWLAWLAVPMLMVHMFEEYGFDALGRTYDLPDMLCKNLGYVPYPECPIPIARPSAIRRPRQCTGAEAAVVYNSLADMHKTVHS